jgi:hypothetical protein
MERTANNHCTIRKYYACACGQPCQADRYQQESMCGRLAGTGSLLHFGVLYRGIPRANLCYHFHVRPLSDSLMVDLQLWEVVVQVGSYSTQMLTVPNNGSRQSTHGQLQLIRTICVLLAAGCVCMKRVAVGVQNGKKTTLS